MPIRLIYKSGELVGNVYFVQEISCANSQRRAIFRCKCGNLFDAAINLVKRFYTTSCGCARIKHGNTIGKRGQTKPTTEYYSWRSMIRRCYDLKDKRYLNYGGRGITVCERWLNSFDDFLADMGKKSGLKLSLERENNDGIYELSNCKWATAKTQARNRRTSVHLIFNGKSKTIAEWAEIKGMTIGLLWARINILKWSIEKALTTPLRHLKKIVNA